jgi:hypothetical protein
MDWDLLRAHDHFYSVLGVIRLLQSNFPPFTFTSLGLVFDRPRRFSLIQQHTHGSAQPIVSLTFYIFVSCIYPSHGMLHSQPLSSRLLPWSSSGLSSTSVHLRQRFLYCIGVHSAGCCCYSTVLSAPIPPSRNRSSIPSRRLFLHWREKNRKIPS